MRKPGRLRLKCSAGWLVDPARIELVDDSEQHRGHGRCIPAGESHFRAQHRKQRFRLQIACESASG